MTACRQWKDGLLDVALGASATPQLEEHLRGCAACAATLAEGRARRQQLDAALGQLVRGAEPSPAFRARVLAAIETSPASAVGQPAWAGVLAAVAVVVLTGVVLPRLGERQEPASGAASIAMLSAWRSPTESLLHSPGDDFLRSTPRLGELYFPLEPIPPGVNSPDKRGER